MTRELSRSGAGPGRQDILEAAAVAFTRNGYDATTIDDIADELRATKGRVYHYYRSKADIFLDVVHTGMRDLLAEIRPLAEGDDDAVGRLERMVRTHAAMMMTRHAFQRVAVQAVEMRRLGQGPRYESLHEIVAMRDEYEQLFADVVAQGQREGSVRGTDPRLATKPVLGALNWITVWYDPDRGDDGRVERIADEYAEFVVGGLRKGDR
ncbi:TetR/AcrR family transcriptional regulator [Pseudonocardia yuanmonensis]|uniref:TetR/AcrR family transcriptional regulator n=1 Tax=Pseudonocardia yuanmonensis TaxID=1095914 RepID=A0ABP8W882_9PSEU